MKVYSLTTISAASKATTAAPPVVAIVTCNARLEKFLLYQLESRFKSKIRDKLKVHNFETHGHTSERVTQIATIHIK